MKELEWVGSSKKDLQKFPQEVRQEMGYILHIAQKGERHNSVKFFKGLGSGVYEIISDYDSDTYRAIYIVKLNNKIYVLHAFKKKSKRGIETPQEEITIIKERLKRLKSILGEG